MNILIAEKPEASNQDRSVAAERPRMPLAAGLMPYGLTLASLLRF
jgi:hypothetical protein